MKGQRMTEEEIASLAAKHRMAKFPNLALTRERLSRKAKAEPKFRFYTLLLSNIYLHWFETIASHTAKAMGQAMTIEMKKSMTTGKALNGKPYAGNPHVRFDDGEVAPYTAAIETEGRNSPSIAQGLPSLRRVHCRRQPEAMTRPQVASRSEVARGLRASVCAATPRRGSLLYRALCATIFAAAMVATSHGATRNAVLQTLDEYVLSNRIAGVVSILSDADYNLTVDCSGWANVEKRVPISTNTVFAIFSMTKTITGAAVMCAIDEGKVSLDDKVSKYLPEYADIRMEDGSKPKRELTLRDLLSHTDGMRWEHPLVNNSIPLREAARLYAAHPMKFQPGETFAYGTMRFSAAAACIEVAVGERFEDYLKRKVLDPLGMRDTTFTPNADQIARLVTAYTSDGLPLRKASDACSRQLEFPKEKPICPTPGGGLFSTPADVIRFSQMLAHHGERMGVRIISRKTFDEVFSVVQVPGELGKKNPYTVGSWIYGDWFGHEGAMRTDQRANLKTGQSRLFFIQTENKAGPDFFALKCAWHEACDMMQGTPPTKFGN